MRPRRIYWILLLGILGTAAFAQSNQMIDELLAEEQATFGPVVHLVLNAAGIIDERSSVQEAVNRLADQTWGIEIRQPSEPIKLGEYAFLLMQAFHLRGGIMYSIIPGPRYASRELAFLGMIPESASPGRPVSGEEVIRILGKLLESGEGRS